MSRAAQCSLLALTPLFIVGCSIHELHSPEELQRPAPVTCISIRADLVTFRKAPLGTETQIFGAGPYISEFEDGKGTYYRAPPGGVYIGHPDSANFKPTTGSDGGLWIPKDPSKGKPHAYVYVNGGRPVERAVLPEGTSCSNVVVQRVWKSDVSKYELVAAITAGGVVGGAVGGAAGAAMTNAPMGRSIGAGAAGGLIAGFIVGEIVSMDIGKLADWWPPNEPGIEDRVRGLEQNKVTVNVQESEKATAR